MEQDSRPNCKYLSEYFGLLLEFARMGDNECVFLLSISAISTMVSFFMAHKQQDNYVRSIWELLLSAFLLATLLDCFIIFEWDNWNFICSSLMTYLCLETRLIWVKVSCLMLLDSIFWWMLMATSRLHVWPGTSYLCALGSATKQQSLLPA